MTEIAKSLDQFEQEDDVITGLLNADRTGVLNEEGVRREIQKCKLMRGKHVHIASY